MFSFLAAVNPDVSSFTEGDSYQAPVLRVLRATLGRTPRSLFTLKGLYIRDSGDNETLSG